MLGGKSALVGPPTKHNLTEVVFTPIKSGATRIAALLSGQVDMDSRYRHRSGRIERTPASGSSGAGIRTVFIGMDQGRDELSISSVKGKNPFKDIRVRKAIPKAIDVEAIKQKIMGGQTSERTDDRARLNGYDDPRSGARSLRSGRREEADGRGRLR